jgi:hypothetical protein
VYNLQTSTESRPDRATARTTNRLVFPHGVANLTLRVDESMPDDYRAAFYGPKPRLTEADRVISIDYSRFNPLIWGRISADITLSPSVSWSIEIRDGVSHWDGDLRNIQLTSIEVRGGVNKAELRLPQPTGTVLIRVSGGASHLALHRPDGVAARVHIGGGASNLALDSQYLGAIGGPVRLETPDYAAASARYDLEIGGGVSKSTIDRD